MTVQTSAGIAYDRAGPASDRPVVLVHAGVADRRMWDPIWPALTAERDALRLDLRGFGESTGRPAVLNPVGDLLSTLSELGIASCDLVGASYGAAVAVETTLTRPGLARSLLLCAPGGSLIAEATADLQAFFDAERAALAGDDLAAAVEANLRWWLDGPHRPAGSVPAPIRELVARMQ
ncbi:MAG: alpha/beta fold hydrolase, partial [Jatrophihabitantaceae bacterium]